MLKKFYVYSQLKRVTDRQTDRQTDGKAISIAQRLLRIMPANNLLPISQKEWM